MKWIVFIVVALAAYPLGYWLRERPSLRLHVWTLLGFLPFYGMRFEGAPLRRLDMNLFFYGARPGDTSGIEVAVIDAVVLALFFAEKRPVRPLPYRFALGAYLVIAMLSVTQADWPLGAFGYVWGLCRMYFVFAVIYRAGHDKRVPAALLRGIAFGIVSEGLWTIWQHYGLRMHRVTGTFAHGNTLGMAVNLAVMVPIALVLAGDAPLLTKIAPLAAVPVCLFTVSRGTLAFFGVGGALVFLWSAVRTFTVRKAVLGFVGVLLALVVIPVGLAALGSRAADEQAGSLQLRGRYENAAAMMVHDHPLGVGPNHFTVMLLSRGYGDRAGIDWYNQLAIVHNVYWLTAAEMGYGGALALAVVFLAPLVSAIRYGLRARQDRRGDVLVGLAVGLTILYVHSFFEWTWRSTEVSFLYWIMVAIVATLARQIREEAPVRIAPRHRKWMARRGPDDAPEGAMRPATVTGG